MGIERFGPRVEEDEAGVLGRPRRTRVQLGEERAAAGRDPYDRDLSDLVGELATQSETFRTHWAAHNVRFHATAVKQLHHPAVGELSLSFNRLDIAADDGLTLFTYAAEPGSRSEEALRLLGSWAVTAAHDESARATDRT